MVGAATPKGRARSVNGRPSFYLASLKLPEAASKSRCRTLMFFFVFFSGYLIGESLSQRTKFEIHQD